MLINKEEIFYQNNSEIEDYKLIKSNTDSVSVLESSTCLERKIFDPKADDTITLYVSDHQWDS